MKENGRVKVDSRRFFELKKLHDKRLRRGECPECGIKLFKIGGALGMKKTPLTVTGRVHEGRCLVCHPATTTPATDKSPNPMPEHANEKDDSVPQYLLLHPTLDDGETAISCITIDQQLRRDNESTHAVDANNQPPPVPYNPSGQKKIKPVVSGDKHPELQVPVVENSMKKNLPSAEVSEAPAASPASSSVSKRRNKHREIFFNVHASDDNENENENDVLQNGTKAGTFHSQSQEEIVVTPETLPTSSTLASKRHLRHLKHGVMDMQDERKSLFTSTFGEYDEDRLSSLLSSASATQTPQPSMLQNITDQLWLGGKQAKVLFQESRGYEFLAKLMWSQSSNEQVEEKAVELFLSTAAFEHGTGQDSDCFETAAILSTEGARNAMEALLFVMQLYLDNQNIQVTACKALVCLTTVAGLTDGQVDDGSGSGAAAVVLSSMEAHKNTIPTLKWCIRALYELSTISPQAESNKRAILAAFTIDDRGYGSNIILDCLHHHSMTEAARLVWCLSDCEDTRSGLYPAAAVLQTLIEILRKNVKSSSASLASLVESLLGAVNNLYDMDDESPIVSNPNELVFLALQAVTRNRESTGLCTAAIALISNIAAIGPIDKKMFADAGGIATIAQLVQDHVDAVALHEESACALLRMAIGSDHIKELIRSPPIFPAVKRLCRLYESSLKMQKILCALLSSLAVTTDPDAEACEMDTIGLICFAMTLHSNPDGERVQESCCIALRNLSSRESSAKQHLISSDAVDLVIEAMSRHVESKVIIVNGCKTLWNVGCCGTDARQSQTLIPCLLKAAQTHRNEIELLIASLRVLLRVLVGSDASKKLFCNENGIEVVKSIMSLHSENDSVMIQCSGILAILSYKTELVPALVELGGISCTVHAICNLHTVSIQFLTSALQLLTNVLLAAPDQSEEPQKIISILIDHLRLSPPDVDFLSEACRFLGACASLSDSVRSRILELGGGPVLLSVLENNEDSDVQGNALEAFQKLTQSTNEDAK